MSRYLAFEDLEIYHRAPTEELFYEYWLKEEYPGLGPLYH